MRFLRWIRYRIEPFTVTIVDELMRRLASIDQKQSAMLRQGERMSQEIDGLKAAQEKLFAATDRMAGELREIADKLMNNPDAAAIIAISGDLNAKADALNAITTDVDTDGSHPAPVEG